MLQLLQRRKFHHESQIWEVMAKSQGSILYGGHSYQSASKALDAYIENFDRNLGSGSVADSKKLYLESLPEQRSLPADDDQQFWGEDRFAIWPLSRRIASDPDLVSLTTEDLVGLPSDGSLPLTHRVALQCRARSGHCRTPHSHGAQAPRYHRGSARTFQAEKFPWDAAGLGAILQNTPRAPRLADSLGEQRPAAPARPDYPRWLTSPDPDLDFSGITSVPELTYPSWLRECDLESDPWQVQRSGTAHCKLGNGNFAGRFGPGSRERDAGERMPFPLARFAHSGTEEVPGRCRAELFREEQIDDLIQKAERAFEALSQGPTVPEGNDGSPRTEEVLEANRSWDNPPVTFKSPVPVGNAEDCKSALIDRFIQSCDSFNSQEDRGRGSRLCGGNHPGPIEALKQMVFSLQTVQQSFAEEPVGEQEQDRRLPLEVGGVEQSSDFETAPGNKSLQRAFQHLKHLTKLVDGAGAEERGSSE
ncbi:lung adenoma susceptibility protein 2 isoform X2 [Callorhinchus milii]|uniref:lung adenoma susceptibility protein 2 isoform X2 n=1 Tax=Callorhinchus milii TaxID=7868 RepID=UPI001C3FD393|nr:lung adenoma susceptibility protein 2 isoform X2 [Callorhinchus milii]